MGSNFTLFQNSAAGGSSASDYLKDAFEDISLPATDNSGLTSTALTNPLSYSFANDDAPRYQTKTLWIKDIALIEDRTKWLSNKPTYEIIWNENAPYAKGYVAGNVRIKTLAQGKVIEIDNIDDLVGVTGVIRQLAWICGVTDQTGTADIITDSVDTTTDAAFGSASLDSIGNGVNEYNVQLHSATKASKDIHDYRLVANEYRTLKIGGVIVYTENASNNIDQFPGSTYVDKDKKTTSVGAGITLPILTGRLGARTLIYKDSNGAYQSSTSETPTIESIGVGTINTNLATVTTGQGGSFPVGTGVVAIASGTSYYFGFVSNQSTDTLTLFPTLPFGLSGPIYKYCESGVTIPIGASLYALSESIDSQLLQNATDPNGFKSASGDYYYSSPTGRYRVWGDQLQLSGLEGYPGFTFNGNTTGFVQIDGSYAALELEICGAGIFNGTFAINGVPAFGVNEGFSGIIKRTVMTSGPGYNSVVFSPGQSMVNFQINKINLYDRYNPSVTLGILAELDTNVNTVPRLAYNASMTPVGAWTRWFADQLYLTGSWSRGTTHTQAGGVFFLGASTNSTLRAQYYGTDFTLIGTAGASTLVTLDGASISSAFNAIKSVVTLGWHSVTVNNQGNSGTFVAAMDFLGATYGGLINKQNYYSDALLPTIPATYYQKDTPRKSKDGDVWFQTPNTNTMWIKGFGRWNQVAINTFSDDPNDIVMVTSMGSTDNAAVTQVTTTEHFNFSSWNLGVASTVARSSLSSSESAYMNNVLATDGIDGSANMSQVSLKYNKSSWVTIANSPTSTQASGSGVLGSLFYKFKGSTSNAATSASNSFYSFNNTSWATPTSMSDARLCPAVFTYNGVISVVGGVTSAGGNSTSHETYNGSSNSTATARPASVTQSSGATANTYGIVIGEGAEGHYKWSGSWSSAITSPYTWKNNINSGRNASAFTVANKNTDFVYMSGGQNNASAVASTAVLNGTSWSVLSSSMSVARGGGIGGAI